MRRASWVVAVVWVLAGCGGGGSGGGTVLLDLQHSRLSVDRTSGVVADGKDAAVATVHLLGDDGKPMAGVGVTFSVTQGSGTFTPATATTDASGQAQAQLTSLKAETETLSAVAQVSPAPRALDPVTVGFVAGAPANAHSTLTVPARGHVGDSLPISVALADANGNPCTGITVTLTASGSGSTLTPSAGQTAADGTFQATLTDTAVETVTVTAGTGGFDLSADVQVLAPAWADVLPEGGTVNSFAFDPGNPAVGYAVSAHAGLFKTVDSGASWFPSNVGLTQFTFDQLVVDPGKPQRLFLTGAEGMFSSENGGASWTPMDYHLYQTVAVDPTQPDVIYAGSTGDGVYKSVDGGKTWTPGVDKANGAYPISLAVDPAAPATVYFLTDQGVFKSTDAGAHWTAENAGLPTGRFSQLVLAPTSPATLYVYKSSGIWRSTDGAASWSALSGPTLVGSLAVDPSNPATVYATDMYGVELSQDSGNTWSQLTTPMSAPTAVGVSKAGALWASDYGAALYLSTDGGANWKASGKGLQAHPAAQVLLAASGATVMAVTADLGVIQSTDRGVIWSSFGTTGLAGIAIQHLAGDPWTFGTYDVLTSKNQVYSSNGGAWTPVGANALPTPTNFYWDGIVAGGTTLYVYGGGMGVYRLTSSTGSWLAANNGLADLNVYALVADSSGALYAATQTGLFKFTDGASSWTKLNLVANTSVQAVAVSASDPSSLYAAEFSGAVFRSVDAGASWTLVRAATGDRPVSLAVDPFDANTVYLGLQGKGIFKSTDGGNTWTEKNSGLWLPDSSSLAIDPVSNGTIYLANGAGVFKTTTAGE